MDDKCIHSEFAIENRPLSKCDTNWKQSGSNLSSFYSSSSIAYMPVHCWCPDCRIPASAPSGMAHPLYHAHSYLNLSLDISINGFLGFVSSLWDKIQFRLCDKSIHDSVVNILHLFRVPWLSPPQHSIVVAVAVASSLYLIKCEKRNKVKKK